MQKILVSINYCFVEKNVIFNINVVFFYKWKGPKLRYFKFHFHQWKQENYTDHVYILTASPFSLFKERRQYNDRSVFMTR